MVSTSRVVIGCVGLMLLAGAAKADTGGYLFDFWASPIWTFQYDDCLQSFAEAYGEADPVEFGPMEFFALAAIRNDELLIVGIDTREFEVAPGNWDIKTVLASTIAKYPNTSYSLEAELWMRPDGAAQWEIFLDTRSETTLTD